MSLKEATRKSTESQMLSEMEPEEAPAGEPYVLSGTVAHRFVTIPPFMIPQTLAYSFLQMNWLQHIVKVRRMKTAIFFNEFLIF